MCWFLLNPFRCHFLLPAIQPIPNPTSPTCRVWANLPFANLYGLATIRPSGFRNRRVTGSDQVGPADFPQRDFGGNFASRRRRTTSAIQFPISHNLRLPVIQAQSRDSVLISALIFGSDSGTCRVTGRGRSGKEDRAAPRHWRGCEIPRFARQAGPQPHP